jgi:DNA-binding beta-propeller fold protein YncE
MHARARAVLVATAVACLAAVPGRAGAGPSDCGVSGYDDRCERWVAVYDDPAISQGSYQFPTAEAVSPDGRTVFVAAKDVDHDEQDASHSTSAWATIAYDAATGARRWIATYVAVAPDGTRVYVTGITNMVDIFTEGDAHMTTIAYDAATGAQLWKRDADGSPGFDTGKTVLVSPSGGRVFAVGVTDHGGGDLDYLVAAYGARKGRPQWTATYAGPKAGGSDSPFAAAYSPRGGLLFVSGWSDGTADYDADYGTVAFRATGRRAGTIRWVNRYDGIGGDYSDRAFALAVSPDGTRVFVTGDSRGSGGDAFHPVYDYATVAYDEATGRQLWDARYEGPSGGFNSPEALAVSPDGARVFVTGQSTGTSSTKDIDYGTVAYDAATGRQLWATRLATPGYEFELGKALAVAADGSLVYATGISSDQDTAALFGGNATGDLVTVAYDAADGTQRWVARSNATGYDFDVGEDVAVGPDGSVYALGQQKHDVDADGSGNIYDTALLAYDG